MAALKHLDKFLVQNCLQPVGFVEVKHVSFIISLTSVLEHTEGFRV